MHMFRRDHARCEHHRSGISIVRHCCREATLWGMLPVVALPAVDPAPGVVMLDTSAMGPIVGLCFIVAVAAFAAGLAVACAAIACLSHCRRWWRRSPSLPTSGTRTTTGSAQAAEKPRSMKAAPTGSAQAADTQRRKIGPVLNHGMEVYVTAAGECWHARMDCRSIQPRPQLCLRSCRECEPPESVSDG